jgi:hypothetical protein
MLFLNLEGKKKARAGTEEGKSAGGRAGMVFDQLAAISVADDAKV